MSDGILKKTAVFANVAIIDVALLLVLSRDCRYCTQSAPEECAIIYINAI